MAAFTLTKEQKTKLIANWYANNGPDSDPEKYVDHKPVVKLFNPTGAATWLLTELDPNDEDTAFGLADLGMGCPELGYVSLTELKNTRVRFGLFIERDLYFKATKTISQYADESSKAGVIVA